MNDLEKKLNDAMDRIKKLESRLDRGEIRGQVAYPIDIVSVSNIIDGLISYGTLQLTDGVATRADIPGLSVDCVVFATPITATGTISASVIAGIPASDCALSVTSTTTTGNNGWVNFMVIKPTGNAMNIPQ